MRGKKARHAAVQDDQVWADSSAFSPAEAPLAKVVTLRRTNLPELPSPCFHKSNPHIPGVFCGLPTCVGCMPITNRSGCRADANVWHLPATRDMHLSYGLESRCLPQNGCRPQNCPFEIHLHQKVLGVEHFLRLESNVTNQTCIYIQVLACCCVPVIHHHHHHSTPHLLNSSQLPVQSAIQIHLL
jgi:hypothetical protein